jgi:hypothetical protein
MNAIASAGSWIDLASINEQALREIGLERLYDLAGRPRCA